MQNKTNELIAYDPVYELIGALFEMTMMVTTPVRQFVTCLLSGFFVVGLLLIIPALLQTAAAYVWAAQVRKESNIRIGQLSSSTEPNQYSITDCSAQCETSNMTKDQENMARKLLSKQDRTLFLYRLLACCASLLVLIFSTLPQLVLAVAKPASQKNIDQMWGWCHAFVYADYSTRCFATYLIVIPFGLMFWNYLFSEIVPRQRLLTDNVFSVILYSSIPIALFSFLVPIPIVARQFTRMVTDDGLLCNAAPDGLVAAIYADFVLTRIIPAMCVIGIGAGFLRWLSRGDYGVFYEPGIFFLFLIPHVFCELLIHICHRAHLLHKLVEPHFSNFMLITYSCYHMSFSSTFVLATLRSIVSEVREEMRKRQLIFLEETPEENSVHLHGTKRRTNLIHGLQKQFSVAFRWKPDFTEEETQTIINSPVAVLSGELMHQLRPTVETLECDESTSANPVDDNSPDNVALHYAILQRSVGLKRQGGAAPEDVC
ncbi:unnamed protein product [Dicrocoelium dendriticum]|nr:unnamed protein product [Dicrocoelium dendriticum]